MLRYLAGKVARAAFVVWAAYTLSFVLLYLLPVNAVDLLFNPNEQQVITPAVKAKIADYYGFNKPAVVQYFDRLWAALHGDMGASVQSGQPVWAEIGSVIWPTIALALCALLLAVLIAFTIAFTASYTRQRWLANLLQSLPPATVSVPVFLIGLILIQVFAFRLGWFPPMGTTGAAALVLPLITLAIPVSGPIAQLLTDSFLTERNSPYVVTAIAKGGTRRWVLVREVFRNASLPALTIAGIILGNLLAGAVVVETIYSRAGLGRLTETAVGTKDIPIIQGVVVVTATVFAVANLAVDLIYPLLDPRLKARIVTS
ncbi:MAG: ABC transporter permease [Actinobacteria bacterium]|nr:ABC transporter permease [Actinomycetota bacterium]